MNKPLISVILPFFNAESTLVNAVNSILNQTFINFELILVDNSSTDNSHIIAKSFSQNNNRVRYLTEHKIGVSHAFNKGLSAAKASLIARMDADDISIPTRLEKQYYFLQNNPEISLVGTQVEIPDNNKNRGFRTYIEWSNKLVSNEKINLNRFVEQPIVNPSILCRKSVFENYGSYQHGEFPEDYDWFLRILPNCKAAKLSEKLLIWNDLPTRLSRTDNKYSTEAFYMTKAKYLAQWLKNHLPKQVKLAIWGFGKLTRKRVQFLQNHGVAVDCFIDVKTMQQAPSQYIFYKDIPPPGKIFIISYVGNRGAREEIRTFLLKRKYQEGIDFLLAA